MLYYAVPLFIFVTPVDVVSRLTIGLRSLPASDRLGLLFLFFLLLLALSIGHDLGNTLFGSHEKTRKKK